MLVSIFGERINFSIIFEGFGLRVAARLKPKGKIAATAQICMTMLVGEIRAKAAVRATELPVGMALRFKGSTKCR